MMEKMDEVDKTGVHWFHAKAKERKATHATTQRRNVVQMCRYSRCAVASLRDFFLCVVA
jgi:hypothetical protein